MKIQHLLKIGIVANVLEWYEFCIYGYLVSTNGVIFETLGAIFPADLRAWGMSLGFTLPTAVLGGTAPALCAYLIHQTGMLYFPVIYIMTLGLIALPVIWIIKRKNYLLPSSINYSSQQPVSTN